MKIPETPTEMQAFIVEQLLQDGSATDEQANSKAQAKFSRQFGADIETCLQERALPEIKVLTKKFERSELKIYSDTEENKSPVSCVKQNDDQVIAILRCDHITRAFLSRLLFGGDTSTPLRPAENPATEIEIGLQNILAGFLSHSLGTTAQLECGDSLTFAADVFDVDKVPDKKATTFNYEIRVDSLKCNLEITVLDELVEQAANNLNNDLPLPANAPNLELMQSQIAAEIKLKPMPTSLKSVQNLKVGDHISLASGPNLEGVFEVNGQTVYNCDIGRSGDIYCLKISERNGSKNAVPPSQPSVG